MERFMLETKRRTYEMKNLNFIATKNKLWLIISYILRPVKHILKN